MVSRSFRAAETARPNPLSLGSSVAEVPETDPLSMFDGDR
jgi:hypothetical protein